MVSLRYWVFCLLLLLIVSLLLLENYKVWTHPIDWVPEKEMRKKVENKPVNRMEKTLMAEGQKNPTSIKPNISIAEKNIFNPERKDFPIQITETKKPNVRPQVILYGVTILGDYQTASITNPGRPLQKGERETFTVKMGEKIGEYKLARILPDRIMMEGPEDSFDVLLYDPKMPKKRVEVKTESKPAPTAGTLPAVSPPTPRAPAPTTLSASGESVKPALTVQERVAAPPPITRPGGRTTLPSLDFRRGRRTLSPSMETPTQATPLN